jgi:hypothetical protein
VETDLTSRPAEATLETLALLRSIDATVVGFGRDAHHEFLLKDRQASLYLRGEQVVGYGYWGKDTGPFALLDAADFPAVLALVENEAAGRSVRWLGLNVPLINREAVDYLLGRGYRLDEFSIVFMTNQPFGRFENYIFCSPPFFM